jgi:ParB family transcriptional regulator, chromosome partitioning protein
MKGHAPEVRSIPVDEIQVLNPRARNKKIFGELVTSIAHLGLKKPITVSERGEAKGYNLVCGQGRLEAFIALEQTRIPAIVIEASVEDCYVMSLVENLARRQNVPLEFIHELGSLRERGYSISDIARKTDFSEEYIGALCHLIDHGEDRLLAGMEKGIIPPTIAMEIARVKDGDVQAVLAEAYEQKTIPGNQFIAIRKIIEQRNLTGKSLNSLGRSGKPQGRRLTASVLVRAYQKEVDRQQHLIKKATLAQSRLLFVVNALKHLLADAHFNTLLRAEAMHTMPRPLAARMGARLEDP